MVWCHIWVIQIGCVTDRENLLDRISVSDDVNCLVLWWDAL